MRRIILLALLAALLAAPAAAVAAGGYLHLTEANLLAKRVAAKTPGSVTLSPCRRTSARTASCPLLQRQGDVQCTYTVHVFKSYAARRYRWRATAGSGDCRLVA